MLRARRIVAAGAWPLAERRGTLTLTYEDRHRRRRNFATDTGESVVLDLPQATMLRHGDALALDDGGFVAISAAPEELIEIAAEPELLTRLAWHLGNRHLAVEFRDGRIIARDDHVIAAMLEGLGAGVRRFRGPFNPEGGAYAREGVSSHTHDPRHDHDSH